MLPQQKRGRMVWAIEAVQRIAETESGCRLRLTVRATRRRAGVVVHSLKRIAHQHSPGDPPDVRQGRPGGPTAVSVGEWVDPDDTGATYRARQIKGWRRSCPLERMMAKDPRSGITTEQIAAANILRQAVDGATIGFTSPRDLGELASGLPGPRGGPSEADKRQAEACGIVLRALKPFDLGHLALLNAVLIDNYTVHAWCQMRGQPNRTAFFAGVLVTLLDILVKHFGAQVEHREDEREVA